MPGQFVIPPAYGPVCQIGLGDVRTAEPTSWMDVSCNVHEAETFRGRERFNDRFEPGTASVTFDNRSGWGDLVGAPITVADALLRPGRPIRIGVQGPFGGGAVTTRWLWRGWIDQAQPDYDPTLHDVVTVNCIDALGESGQTIAPAGPQQGVHEIASDRINRVLDAVGWFPAKRKVSTSTTLVQGTRLGSAAIDLMTTAADTAGGVVYGDLDGDVVYKDIDWMLYDPDVPPDGEIGNVDPGTPPLPDQPAYLDPRPGVVYDPDPPILHHPDCVDVCVAPGEGTVVEQGDAWRIFIHNGHMWYESSGHLWDMGAWTAANQCTHLCQTAGGGGGPPTRQDPGGPIIPGTLSPFGFAVEFLGYSDAGIAEGPQSFVAVAGLTPGPDCMLVVLINALCLDPPGGSLVPFPDVGSGSVTAGSLVFERIDIRESTGLDGAESYAAACEIGRADPGTISVVVDWSGTNQSRTHIVTVWKVTHYSKDLFRRMKMGAYLHAGTHDYPAPGSTAPPPGKGPWALPFKSAETAGTAIVPFTRLTDITIAQSLAEEPTGPFGATFDDTDGEWVTPVFAGVAAVGALAGGFTDDFERADGPLGATWPQPVPPVFIGGYTNAALAISGGEVIAAAAGNIGWHYYATAIPGDHFIELEVADWLHFTSTGGTTWAELHLFTRLEDPAAAFTGFDMRWTAAESGTGGYLEGGPVVAGTPFLVTELFISPAPTFRIRVESLADGLTHRTYIDDILADEQTIGATPATGDYVGFALHYRGARPSIRIESVTAGAAGITRKCSWVAGYRPGAATADVKWSELNTGPSSIQSAQAEVVMESGADVGFTWRTLGYHIVDPTTVPAGTFTQTIRPERAGLVIVAVAAFADPSITITVTSDRYTFTLLHNQTASATGWGQGALYYATLDGLPTDPTDPPTVTVGWGTSVDSIAWTIYEVANAGSVIAHNAATQGTHAAGSAAGALTLALAPAPATDDVSLGFLFGANAGSGEGTLSTPGAGMTDELEVFGARDWLHVESRVGSTTASISWAEVDTSGDATDVVVFGITVRPLPAFATWSTNDPLMIGGARDAFGGPIYSAQGSVGGTPVWNFDPALPGAGAI